MRRLKDIDKQEIVDHITSSFSYRETFRKLNVHNGPSNQTLIKRLIDQYGINIDHFDRSKYHKDQKKHFEVSKICPECGKEFTTWSSGKNASETCSYKCSNIFFAKIRMTEDTKEKIQLSLRAFHESQNQIKPKLQRTYPEKICAVCGESFSTKNTSQVSCSRACGLTIVADKIRQRVKDGTHKGWATRPTASYAEKYFQTKLDSLGLMYKFNHPISKHSLGVNESSSYFLDFYFPEIKLDLEIDGSQHLREDRKLSDQRRDKLLNNAGIEVFRIPWVNPINDKNCDILNTRFNEFLTLYRLKQLTLNSK